MSRPPACGPGVRTPAIPLPSPPARMSLAYTRWPASRRGLSSWTSSLCDSSLIETLQRTIAERGLIRAGERVLVAVSGGPDSLALLHALHALSAALRIELVAAHLDHR